MPGSIPVGLAMTFTSASPVNGLSAIATFVMPLVNDFSRPQTNSTLVVCPFGLIIPSNAAVATDLLSGLAVVVAVGGRPGALGVVKLIEGDDAVPVEFMATVL